MFNTIMKIYFKRQDEIFLLPLNQLRDRKVCSLYQMTVVERTN